MWQSSVQQLFLDSQHTVVRAGVPEDPNVQDVVYIMSCEALDGSINGRHRNNPRFLYCVRCGRSSALFMHPHGPFAEH